MREGDLGEVVKDVLYLAVRFSSIGQFDSAINVLELASVTPDINKIELAYINLGLARAYRDSEAYEDATECAGRVYELAQEIDDRSLMAVGASTSAHIERQLRSFDSAINWFEIAAAIESLRGDREAEARVLQAHASMLVAENLWGASELCEDSLALLEDLPDEKIRDASLQPLVEETYAMCLAQRGSFKEAWFKSKTAAVTFEQLGLWEDSGLAYQNALRYSESAQSGARDAQVGLVRKAFECFVESALESRMKETHISTEAASSRGTGLSPQVLVRQWLLEAQAGRAFEAGRELLHEGNYPQALDELGRAWEAWTEIEGRKDVARVEAMRSNIYASVGNWEKAAKEAHAAIRNAKESGDAYVEALALSGLVRLRGLIDDGKELPRLARMKVILDETRDAETDLDPDYLLQFGAIFAENKDFEYAATAWLDAYERLAGRAGSWRTDFVLAFVLRNLTDLAFVHPPLRDTKLIAFDEEMMVSELEAIISRHQSDERFELIASSAKARFRLFAGDHSIETLKLLNKECLDYESTGRIYGDSGDLGVHLPSVWMPPYDLASALAESLSEPALALSLTSRGKAHALVRRMEDDLETLDVRQLVEDSTQLSPIRAGLIVELLFLAPENLVVRGDGVMPGPQISIFVFGAEGSFVHRKIQIKPRDLSNLLISLEALSDIADTQKGHLVNTESEGYENEIRSAIDRLLEDEAFKLVQAEIETSLAGCTKAWICPHSHLHAFPFHIAGSSDSTPSGRLDWTVVPTTRIRKDDSRVCVGQGERIPLRTAAFAYSSGDLKMVDVEAMLAGGHDSFLNEECNFDNLRELDSRDIVHFACHARFDRRKPDESALFLAPRGQGDTGVVTAADLAKLDLGGATVILSGCSTALGVTRAGDEQQGLCASFFTAGASEIMATRWPVPDLFALFQSAEFYEQMSSAGGGDQRASSVLARSADKLRNSTPQDLVDLACLQAEKLMKLGAKAQTLTLLDSTLRALHGSYRRSSDRYLLEALLPDALSRDDFAQSIRSSLGVATGNNHPFDHPYYWGAFATYGFVNRP